MNSASASGAEISVLAKILKVLWPIERREFKKFFPMALIMLFTLFNYNVLRSLKDALVVPNIGAEAISFIKLYAVLPAAILFMVSYAKMTTFMSRKTIYYTFALFFLSFFLIFAFFLYPNSELIHPDPVMIANLVDKKIDLMLFTIDLAHFKWFVKIYGKWIFVLFYVLAEIWGSVMLSLLFWQFANDITKTNEAKKFYPMFGFIGNFGLIIGGQLIKVFYGSPDMIVYLTICLAFAVIAIMVLYNHINNSVLNDPAFAINDGEKVKKKKKMKLTLFEGFKVIFSSKYLGFIAILVVSYGITINLVEGPWKAKVRELYPTQESYLNFMGNLNLWMGIASAIMMLIGANVLKRITWFSGAILTPVVIFISGIGFFIFVVYDRSLMSYTAEVDASSLMFNPLFLAVVFGMVQNISSKATKYSFFDPTKEMAYIPIDPELKTKGKAAVDIVGARLAKSGGAVIQSSIFIFLPLATYADIAPFLMIVFVIVSLVWLVDVKMLSREYDKYFSSSMTSKKK